MKYKNVPLFGDYEAPELLQRICEHVSSEYKLDHIQPAVGRFPAVAVFVAESSKWILLEKHDRIEGGPTYHAVDTAQIILIEPWWGENFPDAYVYVRSHTEPIHVHESPNRIRELIAHPTAVRWGWDRDYGWYLQ
jgi:hypothetical protein